MMDVIESKGKTVDEAVFSGLLKMDLSIDEVDIEILEVGGSLFKNAKVRMTKKKDMNIPGVVETSSKKNEQKPQKIASHRKDEDIKPRAAVPLNEEKPALQQEPKNEAEKFLLGLFERMGVYAALKSDKADGILKIDISGRGMGMLIGRRGETLDALQYITSLVVNNGKEAYLKVVLDTEDYRKKREESLKRLAVRLADNVVRSGKRVVLEPMNPYERRILHATLQDYSAVTTYSEGEDPFRSVVVALKEKEPDTDSEKEQTE